MVLGMILIGCLVLSQLSSSVVTRSDVKSHGVSVGVCEASNPRTQLSIQGSNFILEVRDQKTRSSFQDIANPADHLLQLLISFSKKRNS